MDYTISKTHKYNIFLLIVIIILVLIDIYLIFIDRKNDNVEDMVYYVETKEDYDSNKKYYTTIKIKKFKKLLRNNDVSTIAIIDNSSSILDKFLIMINKMAYYRSTKIYVLYLDKLSDEDLVYYYNIDDSLSKLDSNYIITVSNNKILSVTYFDEDNIHIIEESLGV